MSTHRLVAITDSAAAGLAPAGLVRVASGGLVALLSPETKPLAAWLRTRKQEMTGLLSFQRLLETLAAALPLLPVAYGSELLTPDDAAALLAAHAGDMTEALASCGHLRQFQVEVRWDPAKAMASLKADGRLRGLDVALAKRDRQAFGRAVQALMEAERIRLATDFHACLAGAARDTVRLPVADEAMILNAAALILPAEESRLDAAVQRIDSTMPDALSIRYLGPLPAVSFATVAIHVPDAPRLAAAQARLGIDRGTAAADIRARYRLAMKAAHPDVAGSEGDAAADLAAAYALALKAANAPRTARGAPLLLDIRREGDSTARRAA
jgi:hypothetical protein